MQLVWLIPALPLLGFLFHAFLGKAIVDALGPKTGRWIVGAVATGVVFGAFAVSVMQFLALPSFGPEHRAIASLLPTAHPVPWIHIGGMNVDFAALVDPLSVLMCLIVTGVGGLIHLYATGYMADDKDYPRFFTYFNLFIFFMLMLVLAENILVTFVGWEGVGLCSYLLISFWFEDPNNAKAGNKAFIVNRIGDVGFALGIMTIFATFGTLSFYGHEGSQGFLDMAARHVVSGGPLTVEIATVIGLLLFVGACGKSAQFPLYIWLPDAMAGPTPVSALIHAATMVTAGVVMITRTSPLIFQSPLVGLVITAIGTFTAIFAASIALTQTDIKKVLAYSTVSQLGYMFMGCGVGAYAAGMFHVTTHAFFKALLFLGAGAVIHSLGGEQDMRKMGGLAKKIPVTHITMAIGWIAIAGIPPLAGFWSKDEILGKVAGYHAAGMLFYAVGLITAIMTAFYMTRLMMKTFYTAQRFDEASLGSHGGHGGADEDTHDAGHGHGHGGVHESPVCMLLPLVVLAALSIFGGFLGMPWANRFEHYLEPSIAHAGELPEAFTAVTGMVIGAAAAAIGIAIGWVIYSQRRKSGEFLTPEQKASNPLYKGSVNLWGVDNLLTNLIGIRLGGQAAVALWRVVDQGIIDGIVNGVAKLVGFFSEIFRLGQTGYVRRYANLMLVGVVCVVLAILWPLFGLFGK